MSLQTHFIAQQQINSKNRTKCCVCNDWLKVIQRGWLIFIKHTFLKLFDKSLDCFTLFQIRSQILPINNRFTQNTCLLIKININETGGTGHVYLFTYSNPLLITCGFRFNIEYLFIDLFKAMSTTAAQVTTLVYLLMQIVCWLHVLFLLILIIYLFTSSKWYEQQQRKSPPAFIYLCKLFVDYICFSF